MDAGGNVPMFGDADDGCVVRPRPRRGFCRYRSLLATGAILFGRGDFKAQGAARSTTRRAGCSARERRRRVRRARRREDARCRCASAFPRAATTSSAATSTRRGEIRLVADAGAARLPLDRRARPRRRAVVHAVGRRRGVPGRSRAPTRITRRRAWRHYFRGTAAHNTVRIDGLDQSVPGGNFMWLRKARAGCSLWLSSAEQDSFEGWHDGYMRLRRPGEAPPPDRARQARAPRGDRGHAGDGRGARRRALLPLQRAVQRRRRAADGYARRAAASAFDHDRICRAADGATRERAARAASRRSSGWVSRRFDRARSPRRPSSGARAFAAALLRDRSPASASVAAATSSSADRRFGSPAGLQRQSARLSPRAVRLGNENSRISATSQ